MEEEKKGLIKLALVQARTGGDARYYDCSISGWTFLYLYSQGQGRTPLLGAGPWQSSSKERKGQTKKGSEERGRRPTRTIEKVGRKGVVRPYPPHLPEILVAREEIGEDTRGK